ncbi:hypothetical protein KU616_24280, partial [Salmonella enterica subsp. enterica serovar Mbandaka]|nr:hypothetical protein [Salmonella enterica subsp. enterica serovar Mbandaka]
GLQLFQQALVIAAYARQFHDFVGRVGNAQHNATQLTTLFNAYLGLIRQSQRAFDMDYCVQLAFENINSSEVNGYGVDHVKV